MTIGERLARARHDSGLSVADVSSRTSLKPTVVDGIEHNDFSKCGGDLHARGQIRAIADALGIPAGPLVDEYEGRSTDAESIPEASAADPILADEATEPIPAVQAAEPTVEAGPVHTEEAASAFPPLALPPRSAITRRVQDNWIMLAGVALLVVAALGGVLLAFGVTGHAAAPVSGTSAGRPGTHAAAPAGRSHTRPARGHQHSHASTARNGQRVQVLRPVHVAAFGPGGMGHGDHPELAHLVLKGNAATPWHSSWYATPDFGNLQSGTGLVLEMGHNVTITRVRVALGNGHDANIELRVGNAPTLARLHTVSRATGVGGVVRLHLKPSRGRYVLLWFTKLPQDHAGTFRASVYKVTVTGYQQRP